MSSIESNSLALVPYSDSNRKYVTWQSHLAAQESLKRRMQNVAECSMKIHFWDYSYFHQYGMGDIVVLAGTSTAGKSSVIKAIKQYESDRLEDGVDLRALSIDLKNLEMLCPREIAILKTVLNNSLSIPKAIFDAERSWKKGISSKEMIEAEEAIQRIKKIADSISPEEHAALLLSSLNSELEMFDDAFEHSRRGKNVIFDVLNIETFVQHKIMRGFNGPLRIVLIYCPFHALSSRMEKRNKEAVERGEFGDQRIGAFPLLQFSEIYTEKTKQQKPFERLTRVKVIKTFDENFDKGVAATILEGGKISSPKEILIKKANLRALLLKNLGFKEGINAVNIAPKKQSYYQFIINSSQLSAEQSAKIIHSWTHRR